MSKKHYQQKIYDHVNESTTHKKLDKDVNEGMLKLLVQHITKHSQLLHRITFTAKIHKSLLIKEAIEKRTLK